MYIQRWSTALLGEQATQQDQGSHQKEAGGDDGTNQRYRPNVQEHGGRVQQHTTGECLATGMSNSITP